MTDVDRRARDGRGATLLQFRRGRKTASERGASGLYDAAFRQASARFSTHLGQLDLERAAAEHEIERLVEMPYERRRLLIENSRRLQTWGLAERLIEEGRRLGGGIDSSPALDLLRTAVVVADKLDPRLYGRYRYRDLQADAWGRLGNALRVAGRYDVAREAFGCSHALLDLGTGCPTQRAQVESLQVSLLNALVQLDAACDLADRALARLPAGAGRLRTDLLIKRATAETDTDRSIAGYREVLDLVSIDEAPYTVLMALQSLAVEQERAGRVDEGHETFQRAGRLLQHASRWHATLLEWVAGCLALRSGELTTATGILKGILGALEERPINDGHLPACCVDIVTSRVEAGRLDEASDLAARYGELLARRGYPPAVLDGWAVVRDRVAVGRLPLTLLTPLGDYFRRAWIEPRTELVLPA